MKTIEIDFNKQGRAFGPSVFGVCKFPNLDHCEQILPKLRESGAALLRVDLYPEQMIPLDKCPDLEAYKANINDIQNTKNWDLNHLKPLRLAKSLGFEIMLSMCYSPDWLNYNHSHKGIPMDFDIYESIIEKAFALVCEYVDYCEIINETVYFMGLDKSPYLNKYQAAADIYEHAAYAIKRIRPDMRIGGWAVEGPFAEEIEYFLSDKRFKMEKGLVDFVSWHVYSTEDCTHGIDDIRRTIVSCGYPEDFPVFIDEWNVTPEWESNEGKLYNYKSIPYVGKNLSYFMNHQANACFFANYPRLYPSDGFHELGECTTLATYVWDDEKHDGYLLPMMKAYRVAGVFLGLATGDFKVYQVQYSYGISAVTAAINSQLEKVIYAVNERPIQVEVHMTIAGAKETTRMECTRVSMHPEINDCFEHNYEVSGQLLHVHLKLPPYSVIGIKLKEDQE